MLISKFSTLEEYETLKSKNLQVTLYTIISTDQCFLVLNETPEAKQFISESGWFRINHKKGRFFTINGLNAFIKERKLPENSEIDWDSLPIHMLLLTNKNKQLTQHILEKHG